MVDMSYVDVFLSPSTRQYISNNTMVGRLLQELSTTFWRPDFWLLDGMTWEDMQPSEKLRYPEFSDVWMYPLLFSAVFMCLRFFFVEPLVLSPLAKWVGISRVRPNPPVPSKVLEGVYQAHGTSPPESVLQEASQETDLTKRQVERWLRRRKALTKPTKYDKFVDCGFNFICHSVFCVYGCLIMYSKSWLWDIKLCWTNYPNHAIDADVWWYYIVLLSYFWAESFVLIPATGRKTSDKVQTLCHHFFTVLLMVFSWTCNFVRVGTLVLLVHECADIPLLAAKMHVYAGTKERIEILFGIFLVLWLVTRCYLFPFWIMHSIFTHPSPYLGMPAAYFLKALICGLFVLNAIWTYLIGAILVRKLCGGVLEDMRSDAEESSDEDVSNTRKTD